MSEVTIQPLAPPAPPPEPKVRSNVAPSDEADGNTDESPDQGDDDRSPPPTVDTSKDGSSAVTDTVAEVQVDAHLKLRVRLDEPSGRYVYQSVDPVSGEVKRQYPPEEALRAIARLHDIAGLAVDKKF